MVFLGSSVYRLTARTFQQLYFKFHSYSQCRRVSVSSGMSNNMNNVINKAVHDAEKIVGFPTSYLSLRALLSNELSAVALHLRKLVQTKHPLLKTARGILFDAKHNVQVRGLVVLLLAKTIKEKNSGLEAGEVYSRQRSLAELTELIHTAFLIHRGLVDIETLLKVENKSSQSELELGNKMAVLSGDYLLANACMALSDLKNSNVVELMSKAISDMSHGFFVLPESGDFSRITSLEEVPMTLDEWRNAMYLAHASLLSNACRATVELAGKSNVCGDVSAEFGKHMVLAWQARLDIERIINGNGPENYNHCVSSELCSLPALLAAEDNGGKSWLAQFVVKDGERNLSVLKDELCHAVRNSRKAAEQSEEVCNYHSETALTCLSQLPTCEERTSLELLTKAFAGFTKR